MGGLAAEAAGGDFKSGALVAGANEALIDTLASQYDSMTHEQRSSLLIMNSQVLGVLVASMAGGDEKDMQTGAWVAGNATQYNYLSHQELDAFEEQARNCKAQGNCDQVREEFRQLSVALDDELNQLCGVNPQDCFAIHGDFIEQRVSLQERMAQLSLDSSIPWQLRADLHVYQLQNTNAVGTLVQAANQQAFEDIGLSSEQAELAAMLAATMATGGFAGKASSSKGKMDASKVTGNVIAQYGPANKGPLPDDIAKTFRSGTYHEVITTEPTVLYRVISNNGNPEGGYWTRTKPAGPVQSIIDSALDQKWGNTAVKVVEMQVPIGTRLFEGVAAPQRGLIGGGNQVYFDKNINPLNKDWVK